jgi:hypothetical protein
MTPICLIPLNASGSRGNRSLPPLTIYSSWPASDTFSFLKTEVSKSSDGPAVPMTDGDETFTATARRLPAEAASRHGGCAVGKETEPAAAGVLEGFRVLRAMTRQVGEEVAAAIWDAVAMQRLG